MLNCMTISLTAAQLPPSLLAGIQITLFTIPRLWEHSEYSDVNDEHKYIAHFTLNFSVLHTLTTLLTQY